MIGTAARLGQSGNQAIGQVIGGTPYDVVAIDDEVFKAKSLISAVIGDNVTAIGKRAFHSNKLATLELGDGVTTIGDAAFYSNKLTSLDLGDNVTTIGQEAFALNELDTLELPSAVTEINYGAFQHNHLITLTLGDTVTSVGVLAFNKNKLTGVILGNSVSSIGGFAFDNNPDLTSVVFTGEAPTSVSKASNTGASFDTASGSLMLTYPWRYGDPQMPGGYTSPSWEEYDTQAITTVNFDLNGHGTTTPDGQDVVAGQTATEPTPTPTASGYEFTGWYTAADGSGEFTFSTAIDGDMTLYAGWEAAGVPGNGDSSDNGAGGAGDGNGTNTSAGGDDGGVVVNAASPLPDTGGAPLGLLVIAGALLSAGAALLLVRRRFS